MTAQYPGKAIAKLRLTLPPATPWLFDPRIAVILSEVKDLAG